jgi:malonate-semialdehyde dehydrogenase (acetylating)/methylmalonate-semialdehyde dehydrogenase
MKMFPMATACGNTMLIKPSEKDPGACMMLVELARQAGFPDGVVNVIHGAHDGLLVLLKIEIFQVFNFLFIF